MKYARWERERRFLLAGPPTVVGQAPAAQLRDRYLRDTRLRLRRVDRPGEPPVYKLGQKIAEAGTSPSAVAHTSLYLDPAEYGLLAGLPADELTKARTVLIGAGPALAVDVFTGRLAGLVLAEFELPETETEAGPEAEVEAGPEAEAAPEAEAGRHTVPGWPAVPMLAEVSDDPRFTGGALAGTSAAELARLLANFTAP
jgi:CYTH domain-containing protein